LGFISSLPQFIWDFGIKGFVVVVVVSSSCMKNSLQDSGKDMETSDPEDCEMMDEDDLMYDDYYDDDDGDDSEGNEEITKSR
jgi:hypothetical protein